MVAICLAVVFTVLGLFHVYWASGLSTGSSVAIPEVNGRAAFRPSRVATLLVAAALFSAGYVVLVRGGQVSSPLTPGLARLGTGVIGTLFVLRAIGEFRLVGFFKRVRGTAFARWDTALFSPLSLAIGLAALWLTWRL